MNLDEAIKYIREWLKDEYALNDKDRVVLTMAIEALRNEINCVKCVHYTERETYTGIKGVCKMDTAHREDLISRSRAIKEVSEWATDILHPKNLIKEDAIGILESLPSEEPKIGWIPVSERLPNEDGEYLVFYEGPITGSCIEIMWYGEPLMPNVDVSGKHFYRSDSEWGDIIYDEVIAWAPLPEPYIEDSEA